MRSQTPAHPLWVNMVKASHNQELKAKIDQNNADQTQESVQEKPPQPRAILACGQKALELELMSCNFNSFPSGDKLSFILYQFEQPSLEIFTHSFVDNEQPQAVINAMFIGVQLKDIKSHHKLPMLCSK